MSIVAIWLNQEIAHLFHYTAPTDGDFHLRFQEVHPRAAGGAPLDFHHQVSRKLVNSERVLIMGSDIAKHDLLICLREHYPLIAKQIIGFEDLVHPFESDIQEIAKNRLGSSLR